MYIGVDTLYADMPKFVPSTTCTYIYVYNEVLISICVGLIDAHIYIQTRKGRHGRLCPFSYSELINSKYPEPGPLE